MSDRVGPCHICGEVKKLSFEHVPPQAAFNDRRVLYAHIQKLFRSADLDTLSGKLHQKGVGGYTLCERCNNNTGAWYGNAFVEWAYQGMQIVLGTQGTPTLFYNFNIFPLRIIKHVACMFFSKNSPVFCPELVKFVLDRDAGYLPSYVRMYAFYTLGERSRSSGVTRVLKGLDDFGSFSKSYTFSEITFPPFGFLMALGSPPPDERLCDITRFSHFAYNDWRTVPMKLPIMPIYTAYPADYRSRDEVQAAVAQQREH